ncbi:hypothetical protein [Phocaeicola faecium]|uniref:Uncharacterized protein n=1 Tax=Phocaeicola faecium TaxID=2762213 RepID=A0ABR8V8G4_9BACT|nr:hypothetical protein [Phocaeicola faecium]MBD8001049.1 hypothetical protein [Phocaeicola faecium]
METNRETTYEETQKNILKELYSHNLADRITKMPISENTRAALYFKGKVQDVLDTLFSLHTLLYGEVDEEKASEFCDACMNLNKMADKYIIDSIDGKIGFRNQTEI